MTRRNNTNPMVSLGPLDGRVGVAGSRATLNRKALDLNSSFHEKLYNRGSAHSHLPRSGGPRLATERFWLLHRSREHL